MAIEYQATTEIDVPHTSGSATSEKSFMTVMQWAVSSKGGVACRSQKGPSGVQTIRLNPDALRPGTIFFAFFNVDYFVHQRFSYVFLVSCYLDMLINLQLATCER